LLDLRGAEPIVTTLGDLKRACGVAMGNAREIYFTFVDVSYRQLGA